MLERVTHKTEGLRLPGGYGEGVEPHKTPPQEKLVKHKPQVQVVHHRGSNEIRNMKMSAQRLHQEGLSEGHCQSATAPLGELRTGSFPPDP